MAKKFDCVRMKDEIQGRLLKKWAGKTADEIQKEIRGFLATSQNEMALWSRRMVKAKGGRM